MTYRAILTGAAVLGLCLLSACTPGNEDGFFGGNGNGGAPSGPGSGGSGEGGGGLGFGVGGNGSGGGGTGIGCSADLKFVVDESGNVLQACGPDEGCADGMCIPACDAAAASKGSVGCQFMVATPAFYVGITPPCFAAFVTNNWDKPAALTISRGGVSYDATQFGRIAQSDPNVASWAPVPATGVPSGQVAVLFLSDDPTSVNGGSALTCPIQPAVRVSQGTAVNATGKGTAWSITSDAPVTVYDILPYGGADSFLPSAELVQPVSAWGTNYVAVLPPPGGSFGGPPWAQLTAYEADTMVTVLPNVALPAGAGVNAMPANTAGTFVLQAGEFVQWQSAEMTGSIIQSDKAVAFTGGNAYQCYTSATSQGGGCDSGHQQIPAVSALGSEYIGMPFKSRSTTILQESIPYRIVGVQDGTNLTFDPPIPGAPATLGLGQSVLFETTAAFRVTSQDENFPFYIGQVMPGCIMDGNPQNDGDEDFVNLLPPPQWLAKYVFFTDPTYPTTNLVFVRRKSGNAFADVNLDCIGAISGWQPIGASGEYEVTNVDLIRNGVPNGTCNNGPHTAESASSFGLMVWGLDSASSYGYPAGGNATTINTVVVPPVPE
jgi:hypothetical protein